MSSNVLSNSSKWIAYRTPRPGASLRLFCFHYAGGGASAFRNWGEALPPFVDVCPVQLPGREDRLKEAAPGNIVTLVEELQKALPLSEMPFALFGHSMGALIAYELASALQRLGGAEPQAVLLGGRRAPQVPSRRLAPLSSLPRADLISELKKLNGVPAELIAHDEFLDYYLRIIRADFALVDSADGRVHEPLTCEVRTYAGTLDHEASPESMVCWRDRTRGAHRHVSFEGDHFFIHSCRKDVLRQLALDLTEIAEEAALAGER